MVRKLKVLGVALAAVFALSAVMASAALAQNGTLTSTGPVKLTAKQIGLKNDNSITMFGGVITCANPVINGFKTLTQSQTEEGKTHELLPNDSSNVTVAPLYGSCITTSSGLEFPMTVDTNGCDFELDLKETLAEHEGVKTPDLYKVTVTEECPTNNTVKITEYSNATKHAENKPFCVIDVTKETDPKKQNVVARDTTNGKIDITGTIEEIKVDRESPTGSILCPKEEGLATLHIKLEVSGDNAAGTATTISLSHL